MAADFKSHVLLRDEKGLVGVPLKRLLLSGVGGGLTYTVFSLVLPSASIMAGFGSALLALIMTGTRGGLPLWQRLLYRVRGSLLLAAVRDRRSLLGQVAGALELPVGLVQLDSAVVFASAHPTHDIDMREWVTFARPAESDSDDGLTFIDSPLTEEAR